MENDRLAKAGSLGAFSQVRGAKRMREGLLAVKMGNIPVRDLSSDEIEEGPAPGPKKSRGKNKVSEGAESESRSKRASRAAEPNSMAKLLESIRDLSNRMAKMEESRPASSPLGQIGEEIMKRGAVREKESDSSSSSSSSSSDESSKKGKRQARVTYSAPAVKKRKLEGDETGVPRGLMVGFEGLTSSISEQNRIALSNIQHRVRMYGNITRSVNEGKWDDPQGRENKRNKFEALSLARGLDLDISSLGQEGAAKLPSAEVRVRRMIALERATEEGSWEVARMPEETFQGYDPETNRAVKEAIKLKNSMERTAEKGALRPVKRQGRVGKAEDKKS